MRLRTALIPLIIAAVMPAARAHAQDSTLDRVHNLMATGRFTEAGSTLEEWERRYADPRSAATPADRARAIYLRAQLTPDAARAEDLLISVVLTYPSAAVAPPALLRLGQSLLSRGDARRAMAYLERLRSDYPGSAARETGMLWLARAQLASGMAGAACATATAAADVTADPNLRLLIQIERDRACSLRD
jgi:tetratricopeptide (TPR) repeat protein